MNDSLDVGVKVPMRIAHVEAAFLDENGQVMNGFSSIHHRNETLTGLADASLDLGWTPRNWLPPGHQVSGRLALSLPTETSSPTPSLSAPKAKTTSIFFGTGTYNPVWALSYFLVTGEHSLATYANGIVTLYENEFGYTGPSLVNLGAIPNYSGYLLAGFDQPGCLQRVARQMEGPAGPKQRSA